MAALGERRLRAVVVTGRRDAAADTSRPSPRYDAARCMHSRRGWEPNRIQRRLVGVSVHEDTWHYSPSVQLGASVEECHPSQRELRLCVDGTRVRRQLLSDVADTSRLDWTLGTLQPRR